MERLSIVRISTKIEIPTLTPQQVSHQTLPSSINYIKLEFKMQIICNHFLVEENEAISLVRQHKTVMFPFSTCYFAVNIFNDYSKIALEQFLLMKFRRYGNDIASCSKTIAEELIEKWITIKDEAMQNSRTFDGKVFPFLILLKLWNVATLHERPWFMNISDPASSRKAMEAMEAMEMLRRVRMEEIGRDEVCSICLEEMGKEEESNAMISLLQMPCLHVFHEECIQRWLNERLYCPICRFQMPID